MENRYHEIKEAAAVIEHFLECYGQKTASELQKMSDITETALFHEAIGWLARENKINFVKAGKNKWLLTPSVFEWFGGICQGKETAMNVSKKLKSFLDQSEARYEVLKHPKLYTAQEIAAREHIPGKEVAKAVMVKADDQDVMVVASASSTVDLLKLRVRVGTNNIRLADEHEFRALFPDSEVGAEPPFGSLYDLPCFIDQTLAEDKTITFNAGSHSACIRMSTKDFLRLSDAEIGDFAVRKGVKAAR